MAYEITILHPLVMHGVRQKSIPLCIIIQYNRSEGVMKMLVIFSKFCYVILQTARTE
jgi:hypothetical protein